jgi:hypothetical protein
VLEFASDSPERLAAIEQSLANITWALPRAASLPTPYIIRREDLLLAALRMNGASTDRLGSPPEIQDYLDRLFALFYIANPTALKRIHELQMVVHQRENRRKGVTKFLSATLDDGCQETLELDLLNTPRPNQPTNYGISCRRLLKQDHYWNRHWGLGGYVRQARPPSVWWRQIGVKEFHELWEFLKSDRIARRPEETSRPRLFGHKGFDGLPHPSYRVTAGRLQLQHSGPWAWDGDGLDELVDRLYRIASYGPSP